MIRACIFDLDGTIINTEQSLVKAVNDTLNSLGYPGTDVAHVRSFIGHGGKKLIKCAVEMYEEPSDELVEKAYKTYKQIFAEACTYKNEAYEGMEETLKELKERGLKIAVISNKSQEGVESCIHKVYGDDLFDHIAGEKPGVPLKPDPTGILNVVKALDVKPQECLYIGDGETDMLGGRAAGCITIGVTWGFRSREVLEEYHPDYMIDSPLDMLTLTPYVYELDGTKMIDKDAFYNEVISKLTDGLSFDGGHNLDALADILGGGYGKHSFDDSFGILWQGFESSKESLGETFVLKAIEVMLHRNSEYYCELKVDNKITRCDN